MSEYGTAPWSLGRAIRTARVSRVRAADLERWGAGVMELEDRLEALERLVSGARRACAGALWLMGNDGDRSRLNKIGWIQPPVGLAHERLRNFCYSKEGEDALAAIPAELREGATR